MKQVLRTLVPDVLRTRLYRWRTRRRPLAWGDLRRLQPVSRQFGFDRGQCIDRYYIERFLEACRADIRGDVMEVADATYTRRFGAGTVTRSHVLHACAGNAEATLVGDLATGEGIPSGAFDCMILTQVFPFIYDVRAAVQHCHQALRPGGVLLATFAGVSQISRYDMDRWGDFWRFTTLSAARLFGEVFGTENVEVASYGNVLTCVAFMHGLAVHEVDAEALTFDDPDYQMLITVRAIRRQETG